MINVIIGCGGSGKSTFAKKHFPNARCFESMHISNAISNDETVVFIVQKMSEIPRSLLKSISGWYCFKNADCDIEYNTSKLQVGEYIYVKKVHVVKIIVLVGEPASGKTTFAEQKFMNNYCIDIDSLHNFTEKELYALYEFVLMVRSVKEIPSEFKDFVTTYYCFRNADLENVDASNLKVGDYICVSNI